jgi:Na+-transporting methylmalonyl-CoA/oxaloacetate decarboxylase gamma subunit
MKTMFILLAPSNIYSFASTLVIVGVVVVFAALTLLVVILNNIPRIGDFFMRLVRSISRKPKIAEVKDKRIPAQVSAALSAAIYLYLDEIHDKESRVMTIRKVSKHYSPWSSKIYGLNILRK